MALRILMYVCYGYGSSFGWDFGLALMKIDMLFHCEHVVNLGQRICYLAMISGRTVTSYVFKMISSCTILYC